MKTSKKLLALLLVFVLCVSAMVGCSKKEEEPKNDTPKTEDQQTPATDDKTDGGADAGKAEGPWKFALTLQNTWNPFLPKSKLVLKVLSMI